jgi:hypothetical protein
MNDSQKSEKIGSLWKKVSKKGVSFLSGVINEQRVVVFKVREKRNAQSPDYAVFESERPAARADQTHESPVITDSDIPF